MINQNGLCVVPLEIIAEILTEWRERFEERTVVGNAVSATEKCSTQMGVWAWLSHETGIDPSRLSQIAKGFVPSKQPWKSQTGVTFNTADRILCAIDRVDEWHHGRLKDFYGPIEVGRDEWDRSDLEKAA